MKKPIPIPLWVSIVALGLITLLHLVFAFKTRSVALFIAVPLEALLVLGLVFGWKWAYVLIVVFSVLGVATSFAKSFEQGLGVLVVNAIVAVPMVICTRFFFPKTETQQEDKESE